MTVTADDLDAAISCVMSGLLPLTDRDWSVRAGTLEWDCWHTAEHIGDCLLSYAWQLAVQPTARYVRAIATAEKDASPAEVLEFAATGGRVVARGFGRSLDPSRDVCRRVLARLFPQASSDLAGTDPWTALLWAGGRLDLPSHPQLLSWRPNPAPLTP